MSRPVQARPALTGLALFAAPLAVLLSAGLMVLSYSDRTVSPPRSWPWPPR